MTDALRQEQQIGTHIAEELNRTACLLLQAVNDEDIPPEGLHEKIVTYTSRLRGIIDDFGLTESPGILSLTLRQFDATTRNISVPNTPEGQQLIERLFRYAQSIENGND